MRAIRTVSTAVLLLAAVACGQPAATVSEAQAQPTTAAAPAGVSAADRAAILRLMNLTANARGQVENECGERVTPQFIPVELGGAVGTAVLFAIGGGPNTAACYGDGPGLTLFKREGAAFRDIYSSRGAFLVVLSTARNGVKDLAEGGPGMQHPRYQWNGTTYAQSGSVPDSAMGDAQFYPQ